MKKAHSSPESSLNGAPQKRDKNGELEPVYLQDIRDRIKRILNGSKEFKMSVLAVVIKKTLVRHSADSLELRQQLRDRFVHMLKSRNVVLTDTQGTPIGTKRPASKKHKEPAVKRPRRGGDKLNEKLYNHYLACASEPSTLPLDHPERVYLLAARRELGLPLNHPNDLTVQGRPALSDEEELTARMEKAADLNAVRQKYVPREATLSERLAARFQEPPSHKRYRQ